MIDTIHDISFIGCGSAGRALGRLLAEANVPIRGVCCARAESAREACRFMEQGTPMTAPDAAAAARTVLIATPDRAIVEADRSIASSVNPGTVVLHLSGALSSSILAASAAAGAHVGSMHPLQSFPDPQRALELVRGSIFACEGEAGAVRTATAIAHTVGGRPITISTDTKPLYHAAAVAASNFLVSLLSLSVDLMEKTGMDRKTALEALMPLIDGTLKNARAQGLPQALTGPVERGDTHTVHTHLETIRALCPELEEKYQVLTGMTIEAALRKGSINEQKAAEFHILCRN